MTKKMRLLLLSVVLSFSAHAKENPNNIFVPLAKKVLPSVVNISTLARAKAMNAPQDMDELFERFFGVPRSPSPRGRGRPPVDDTPRPLALGSGFIIDASGLILTNNHVIEGADVVQIFFTEDEHEKPTEGEVIGVDPDLDLALIQVKTKRKLTALPFGDSDELEVGEYVMAAGNPFGQGHSVSHGIVSAKGREAPNLAKYIQTDAPINPGNSGGPLVNLQGEVIGINNAIDARAQGIGFAIPINQVIAVLPQLKTKGSVSRGYLGVGVNPLTSEISSKLKLPKDLMATFVVQVVPGGPADQAGVEVYDVITKINGQNVRSPGELTSEITKLNSGDQVRLEVYRDGKKRELTAKLGERPVEGLAKKPRNKPGKKNAESDRLGLSVEVLSDSLKKKLRFSGKQGVFVENVSYQSPAYLAGIQSGDILLEIEQKPIRSVAEYEKAIQKGNSFFIRIRRITEGGAELFIPMIVNLK